MVSSTPLMPFQAKSLTSLPLISHGFFTRQGGVSSGFFESLNMGLSKGDSQRNVFENRRRIGHYFNPNLESVCFSKQVHGNKASFITGNLDPLTPPETDALVTNQPGLVIGILTADCVPLLIADSTVPLVAAVHAGWRGALKGIVEATIQVMRKKGSHPSNLIAAIGPAIAQGSYEVGPDVYNAFEQEDPASLSYFRPQGARWFFDLPGFVQGRLEKLNLGSIERLPHDTYQREDLFFSCRRANHHKEPSFGNQASCIMIEE